MEAIDRGVTDDAPLRSGGRITSTHFRELYPNNIAASRLTIV